MCFTWFYWVLSSFTGIYWISPNFTGFYRLLLGFLWVEWYFTAFIRFFVAASMGFTGFYRVLLAFTELNCLFFFALVYSGFTVLHRDFIQLHLLERSRIGLDRVGIGFGPGFSSLFAAGWPF